MGVRQSMMSEHQSLPASLAFSLFTPTPSPSPLTFLLPHLSTFVWSGGVSGECSGCSQVLTLSAAN